MLLEFHATGERQRLDREERLHDSARANRELVRNLAHEIKNPLGGIRGAAQLLEMELTTPELREYTQVIIKEADRLQKPGRSAARAPPSTAVVRAVNVHEVCERVRSILLAEYPEGWRSCATTTPACRSCLATRAVDPGLLNLVAQRGRRRSTGAGGSNCARASRAMWSSPHPAQAGTGIACRRQWTGYPEQALLDRVFFPLVSGREGGSGLGLPLAQTFIERHGGTIECESRPGLTDFRILLPLL